MCALVRSVGCAAFFRLLLLLLLFLRRVVRAARGVFADNAAMDGYGIPTRTRPVQTEYVRIPKQDVRDIVYVKD